jgi:hypothetical protein
MSDQQAGYPGPDGDDDGAFDEEAPLDAAAPDGEAPLDTPQPDTEAPLDAPGTPTADEPLRTGDPAVDEVLVSMESLGGRPVEEHPEIFERAHDQLRSALDGPQDS